MTTQILNKVLLAVFLTAAGNFGFGAYAFEVSGETFNANFKITSWIAKEDGSTITSEGYLGDKYGQVYLTHNLKGRAGQTNQGRFSGQLRSINAVCNACAKASLLSTLQWFDSTGSDVTATPRLPS